MSYYTIELIFLSNHMKQLPIRYTNNQNEFIRNCEENIWYCCVNWYDSEPSQLQIKLILKNNWIKWYTNYYYYMQDIRPFVKWAWWKRWILSQLVPYFPEKIDHYTEPFLWWWAVLIYILQTHKVKSAYAFDINPNLINCYQVIKY